MRILDIPDDIRFEVGQRFAEKDHETAFEILAELDKPRIMRCALHSSSGDIEDLWEALAVVRKDYRDLIFWTEYDKSGKRIWDFNRPFPEARIGGS